jgi:glutaredoxin 3
MHGREADAVNDRPQLEMEEIMSVNVYSTPACVYCKMAKKYLETKNISYNDIDVSADREAAAEMVEKSGQRGVPVIDFNGTIIVGFDKSRIDSLIL